MYIWEILNESRALGQIVNVAIKAKKSLSPEAQQAVQEYQQINWDTGKLEQAYRGKNPQLYNEIEKIMKPVRQVIRKLYGDTITLYRGQRKYTTDQLTPNRILFSWTAEPTIAQKFAHDKLAKEITDEEIQKAIEQYNRTGFVSFRGYKYVRNRENSKYFWIYRGKEVITDGDNLLNVLKDRQESIQSYNEQSRSKGQVFSTNIPVENIVWVTNDLKCLEFICKNNPLKDIELK